MLKNIWPLAKLSWGVLRKDRELLWIPVLSFLTSAGVLVGALILVSSMMSVYSGRDAVRDVRNNPAVLLLFVLAALALGVVTVFFNGALVAGAHERLTGGNPTVSRSIKRAFARVGGLVPWAILTTTVGLVLRMLRSRSGWLGRLALRFLEMAWEVASYLTVPAIMIDNTGAMAGLRRSTSLLRQTWGENIASRVGFGLIGFLGMLPAVAIGAVLGFSGVPALAVLGIVVAVIWVAVLTVVLTALSAVFQTALYLYAVTGVLPSGFQGAQIKQVFKQRVLEEEEHPR